MASSTLSSASSVSSSTKAPRRKTSTPGKATSLKASPSRALNKQTIVVNGSTITVVPSKTLLKNCSPALTRTVIINGQRIKVVPSKILSIKLDIPPTKGAITQISASSKKNSTVKSSSRKPPASTPAKRRKRTTPKPVKATAPKTASNIPSTTAPAIVCKEKTLPKAAKAIAAPKKPKQASIPASNPPVAKSPPPSKKVHFSQEVEVKHFLTQKPPNTVQTGPVTFQKLKK